MDPLSKTLTLLFLITTMAAIGLKVTTGELVSALRDRGLMARSLVVNMIIVIPPNMLYMVYSIVKGRKQHGET